MSEQNLQVNWAIKTFEELSKQELYLLLRLRTEIFVVEQNCPYQECDNLDQEAMHVMGKDSNGKIITYLRFYKRDGKVIIGRVLTRESYRGQGLARALMSTSMEILEDRFPGEPISLSAQTYLIDFYRSYGFETEGKEYLEDGIPHIKMIKPPLSKD